MEKIKADDKIFQAAMSEFIEKGFTGARMQSIADKAGINKALLHYYFKSKDLLYKEVFQKIFTDFFTQIMTRTDSGLNLRDYMKDFISNYIDNLTTRRHLLKFLIWELESENDNLSGLIKGITKFGGSLQNLPIYRKIEEAKAKNEIRQLDTFHLIISIVGMCLWPFVAHKIVKSIWQDADLESEDFRNQRKMEIYNLVWHGINKGE